MPAPGPKDPPQVWIRTRVQFACSRPACRTTYVWLGAFHPASADAEADDRATATASAALLGWTFPPSGNVCPRPHPKEHA